MALHKKKAWGGRFTKVPDPSMEAFTSSLAVDRRLAHYDIQGSVAHCKMLVKRNILTASEGKRILKGLAGIERELQRGTFPFLSSDEDIHMAIERRLTEKIGAVGGKIHTARSRNDQVLLDVQLYMRDEISQIRKLLASLQKRLTTMAKRHRSTILPGYTHLQRAQPILLAHHFLAYHAMLQRDARRLRQCEATVNVLPLGAGALSGTTLPIDRAHVAKLLRFEHVSDNSLDTVSDRDFIVEFLSFGAILGMHLSRFSEELVLWSSSEFGFIDLPEEFATGSSMMPQKKNPDVPEIIRGKTGRLYGNLFTLLTILKGLPLAYNRDLQEDKEPLFDTVDTLKGILTVLELMLRKLRFDTSRMRDAASSGFLLATDVADYLVEKKMPFRQAHAVGGAVVQWCVREGRELHELTLSEWQQFSLLFEADLLPRMTLKGAVERRASHGGTSPKNVERQLRSVRA